MPQRNLPARGAALALVMAVAACGSQSGRTPVITLDQVPVAAPEGGQQRTAPIGGRVTGASAGQRIVVYAKTEGWWVQPLANAPFTTIAADATWKNQTHLGSEYAALLVEPGFEPPPRADALPALGSGVVAVASAPGTAAPATAVKTLAFSGYDWEIRQVSSDRGGLSNPYDPGNATVDERGRLRLRIAGVAPDWTAAEVALTRSLGYGTYTFVVGDTSHLEPAAALSLFTWDYQGLDQGQREMDIEISRWGDPASRNAQFVVQPYYIPQNVLRFNAPAGVLTHVMRWEPGRVSMRTLAGAGPRARLVAEHSFTSGVPTAGNESVRIALYPFRGSGVAITSGTEVTIEKFEYLP